MNQPGLFDLENRLESLSQAGDPLIALNEKIDWKKFNNHLKVATRRVKKSNAGRKPYSSTLMFKILVLQSLYNLSDEQMEFQIRDRLSFMRFLGLNFEDRVPDQKTIWHYREMFVQSGVIDKLFNTFNRLLDEKGLVASKGTLVDASIIEAPKQRNSREENAEIKKGKTPEKWKDEPNKLRQKDTDARWVTKNNKTSYGYKMHIGADNKYKLIRKVVVTSANVHDSQVFDQLLVKNKSKDVWADSAYYHLKDTLPKGYREHFCKKGKRGKPLSEKDMEVNRKHSKIRCRVEHIFGHLKGRMNLSIRCIGKIRAEAKIVFSSLVYNMDRCVRIQ